jgi:hypothetical protein
MYNAGIEMLKHVPPQSLMMANLGKSIKSIFYGKPE